MKIVENFWGFEQDGSDIKKITNENVILGKGITVNSFRELIKDVAYLSYYNPSYSLFFRGQELDFKNKSLKTTIYPKLYRSENDIAFKERKKERQKKISLLRTAEKLLIDEFQKEKQKLEKNKVWDSRSKEHFVGFGKLKRIREMQWAILQHYEVCDTPVLDVTQSLGVASSFALNKNKNKYGYVYVIALPNIYGSISFYAEDYLLNIKLSSICMPEALRPYYQEGFAIMNFPITFDDNNLIENLRSGNYDFSRRVIAKFKIKKANFWGNDEQKIPKKFMFTEDYLYPNDYTKNVCNRVKEKLENDSNA